MGWARETVSFPPFPSLIRSACSWAPYSSIINLSHRCFCFHRALAPALLHRNLTFFIMFLFYGGDGGFSTDRFWDFCGVWSISPHHIWYNYFIFLSVTWYDYLLTIGAGSQAAHKYTFCNQSVSYSLNWRECIVYTIHNLTKNPADVVFGNVCVCCIRESMQCMDVDEWIRIGCWALRCPIQSIMMVKEGQESKSQIILSPSKSKCTSYPFAIFHYLFFW